MATTVTTPTPAPPFWPQSVWTSIQNSVIATAGQVRVSQNVFQTQTLSGVTSVPAPQFNPANMSLTEGITLPYVELAVEFPLTNGQVNSDPSATAAMTLAKFAARNLALAEDIIILQGVRHFRPPSRLNRGGGSLQGGIMGLATARVPPVAAPAPKTPTNSGLEVFCLPGRSPGCMGRQ